MPNNFLVKLQQNQCILVEVRDSAESSSESDSNSDKKKKSPEKKKKKSTVNKVACGKKKAKQAKAVNAAKCSNKQDGSNLETSSQSSDEEEEEGPPLLDRTKRDQWRDILLELNIRGTCSLIVGDNVTDRAILDEANFFFRYLSEKNSFDKQYFEVFCQIIPRADYKTLEYVFPKFDFVPKTFLRSWYDPSMAGVDKEETLTWITTSLENIEIPHMRLKVII